MNHEVYAVRSHERVDEVLGMILTLGITAAPVVDEDGQPLGLVALRNLARAPHDAPVGHHMTSPAATIGPDASVEEAGQQMGQLGYHHLVVVDGNSQVIGFVSSLDVIRGLVGLPATHPPAFHHEEPESGLSWTGDLEPTREVIERLAPDTPGMLVLSEAGNPSEVVWAEASRDVRARLLELLRGDRVPEPVRERGLAKLRFRAAPFGGSGLPSSGTSVIDVLLGGSSE